MVEMSTNRIFADGYGMGIVGISRRDMADIHFGLSRYRTSYMKSGNSNATVDEGKYLSVRNHICLLMITRGSEV
jgi:hypothetical protein